MISMFSFAPACLFGSGMASISWGATRHPDTGLKTLGAALLVAATSLAATPALADQFVEAADNAKIDCTLSRDELTRIALVGDEFSSVSKIASGYPYNDFGVTHEPVRGDIYISVPPSFAANSLSFFATSKQGFVYKFVCHTAPVEAHQLFVTNPALAKPEAETWENERSEDQTIIALIKAMAESATPPGYSVYQRMMRPVRTGDIEVQLITEYRGAGFNAQQFILTNRGKTEIKLNEAELAPKSARAISITQNTLKGGTSTSAYVVTATRGAVQ
ncbi:MAG: type-F conjugative transfer system secretin TraK [Parasphingorhabdus sp.]|jgi:conjugal transfer pilus assembly protein TraK|nr:MAG: conjugal transfer protein TraK [Sphingopyxis sp.]|tara:strand:- start:45588 stop:46412 length:825 start_codon:yes stop_codon:yes gene_type:complete